ncbi:DNA polymerase III subunit alpha [Sporosarcina sp. 179-K 3D1 HS]|uniref:DNA polymerase III subunit alpha n=1 Tax=Sporosarcina sp. 179-K 3D1 HS TaxID=3232169 RepID=UPI0039A1D367
MPLVYPQLVSGADLLRGIIKLDQLAPLLQRRGAASVGLVNSKLYGVRSFYKTMMKYGIHPVIGLSVQLQINEKETVLLYVYAKDDRGFHNLMKMSSAISIRDDETLPLQWLQAYQAGLVIVCPLTDRSWDEVRTAQQIQTLADGCQQALLLIGIARPGGERHVAEADIESIAEEVGLSIVACQESRYIDPDDAFAYEAASAIRNGYKLNDPARPEMEVRDAYLPEKKQFQEWFADRREWLKNCADMLLSCNAGLPATKTMMPAFPVPEGETAVTLLERNCLAGLKRRVSRVEPSYLDRLQYEVKVIQEMGYADYFLIVEDFMRFAAENRILTGPGRGSSAGSLVAYALGITDVDPIRYGLIFERFLNPGRITMPDIDIDFADNRRSEVLAYVARKYGTSHVAQIITFGTLSSKAVARDVARVFDFSNEEMSFLSRNISGGTGMSLNDAVAKSKALQDWITIDPIRSKWLEVASMLEGLPRNASTHAAGVILSPAPLVERVPLQQGGDGIYLTQWAMGDVEEQGLLKMDFLGLRNLTLLDRIRSMIAFDKGIHLVFDKIPLNDEKTFELFRSGDTTGIFQFESEGMRDALRMIQPTRFEDLFAVNALYRPGPMENIPLYSRRKNGQEGVTYIHPALESVLSETYGVIVYQEQIMQIAYRVAGYSMAEADLLRRAISKKNRVVLQEERGRFVERALEKGFPEEAGQAVYDLIVKFADYGFPKSHAVAYSLISYRLAFLKANESAYFYAALLSSVTGNAEKTMELMREAEVKGITILPPSVLHSQYRHTVEQGRIRVGLCAVKGVTPSFYKLFHEARKSSDRWSSMFDMAAALGSDLFKEKTITPLIKAGALDEFNQPRAVLLASIDAAISHALFIRPDDEDDFLSSIMTSIASPKYSPGGTMPRMLMLEYEREVLGFYLSEHPALEAKRTTDQKWKDILSIHQMANKTSVSIIGLLANIKRIRTKKGEAMAFLEIQDETGVISCTLFPQQYADFNALLHEMTLVYADGNVEWRNGKPQIIIRQMNRC